MNNPTAQQQTEGKEQLKLKVKNWKLQIFVFISS